MAIDKATLEHLAGLARLELDAREEEQMLRDLEKILNHFQELQDLDTASVSPLAGGIALKNVFREERVDVAPIPGEFARAALPHTEDGFLKIPQVFEGR